MSKNILVVDDTPDNLRLLTDMLSERNYKVQMANNGAQALATSQKEPPDLILLDIMMPEMDGFEVCHHLKADERTQDIPVIFISGLDQVLDKMTAFSIGGVDYITKPFHMEEVLARVHAHLSLQDLQRQLQAQNEQLRQQNAELDAFAHTVAHDLRNPLSRIITSLSLLKEYAAPLLDQELQDILNISLKTGYKIESIINELLLLASVRKGQIRITALNMVQIIEQVRQRLSNMIEKYEAQIVVAEVWPQARGYAPWVEEVWANYISNGLKYGGEPPRLVLGSTPQPDGQIRFWVRDNGVGLTPEEQGVLFTEFTRLNEVRAEGHGLGLSIVRRIVEKLGGRVGVQSQPGQGSEFYFTLPQQE